MIKKISCLFFLLVVIFTFFPSSPAFGQVDYPTYIVRPGDTLNLIASRFGVKPDEIIRLNNISNPNFLSVGSEIKIPGLEGVRGIISLEIIPVGETLKSLSKKYQQTPETILRINKITSPTRLFAGATLIIPKPPDSSKPISRYSVSKNQSLFEKSILTNQNQWNLILENGLNTSSEVNPGDLIFVISDKKEVNPATGLSPYISKFEITPLPLVQGKTTEIKLDSNQLTEISGKLVGKDLRFWLLQDNQYVALQGIHALSQTGLVPLTINAKAPDGTSISIEQILLLQSAGFTSAENIVGVDPKTLDPEIMQTEEKAITSIVGNISASRLWTEKFRTPSHFPDMITSFFGRPRSYNGGVYKSYHSGLDYGYGNNLPIYSPAPGKVVYTETTVIRGNATIIDHGWGVFSGFWHQSKINVKVGDIVQAGQPIGLVGNTGRSTGSHLHWELWVNGNQVDPLEWLNKSYP